MEKKQEALNKLYEGFDNYLKDNIKVGSSGWDKGTYSNPLLINIKDINNINTDVMVFGQETRTWCNKENTVKEFIDIYARFVNAGGIKSPFWQCFNEWLRIKKNDIYVWNNLSKVDYYNGYNHRILNSPDSAKILTKSAEIIKEEIKIIEPKILIFLTGPHYDFIIQKYLGGKIQDSKKIQKLGLVPNQLCEYKLEGFEGIKAFRTYHPNYLNRCSKKRYPNLKNNIVEFLRKEIEEALS